MPQAVIDRAQPETGVARHPRERRSCVVVRTQPKLYFPTSFGRLAVAVPAASRIPL
jgi:hypothetical protein